MMGSSQHSKKDMNFELNLLPVFDILSVCICFLLMTVVWVQIGSMNVQQALDGSRTAQNNPPTVWAYLGSDGSIKAILKDAPKSPGFYTGAMQLTRRTFASYLVNLKRHMPDIRTAIVVPDKATAYEDVITVMDQLKKNEIRDVGVSPI